MAELYRSMSGVEVESAMSRVTRAAINSFARVGGAMVEEKVDG